MENPTTESFRDVPNDTADFGNVPNTSENIGSVPQPSESFGNVPQASESFRTLRQLSERTEKHTQTVRDVARQFDEAGVSRTERSIINWCRLNRHGVARLDAFFDENEGRYYITAESVTRAIAEEKAKQTNPPPTASTPETEISKGSERQGEARWQGGQKADPESERKIRDLEITTRAKDFYIEKLEKERGEFVEKMIGMSRYVGELETQMLHLGGAPQADRNLPQTSEAFGKPDHGEGK